MFELFWHDFLYQPVFNFLIWIYNNWTNQNLGAAIIYLTILLRIALLPFTIVTEKAKAKNAELEAEIVKIQELYKRDPELKKQEIRKVLKKRKVYPWARMVSIGVQVVVFLLLYQVFLRGITGDKVLKILYPVIDFPGKINTIFLGLDLAKTHDLILPGIVMVWLMGEIFYSFKGKSAISGDLAYFIAFPVFVFAFLWWLPTVKSLFILTSMVFSFIVHQ
nr:YidC/Oxa1 family membrane protein insertase [Candidatus Magasanikbacteria bacterium]